MKMVFEQLPREGNKAFAAFKTYLDMGPQRSLAAVAERLGKSKTMMEKWSRRHGWVERVQAHTLQLAELERAAIERATVEKAVQWEKMHEPTKREAWLEAEKTIAMVRKARELWEDKGRPPGWEGMARMLELAFKLKQFAAGMPSEVKEVRETHTTNLRVEWEVALRKIYGPKETAKVSPQGEARALPIVEVEAVKAGE